MKPGPRALYIELKRRFNGANNGEIFLSHRDAARALAVHRNTVGAWFEELSERGFIKQTAAPYLGPSGVGIASKWELQELQGQNGQPATKEFMRYKTRIPAQKTAKPGTKLVTRKG